MAQVKATQEEPDFQNITLEITLENNHELELLYQLANFSATGDVRKAIKPAIERQGLNFFQGEPVSQKIFEALDKFRK